MVKLFTAKEKILMKLPNGYGNVSKLKGKRRNPWRARKTIGWELNEDTGKSKQIYATIGYFSKREDALSALAKYNQDPYDLKSDSITFSELYDKWSSEHFTTIVPSAIRTWKAAYNHCVPIHTRAFKDLRVADLESTIANADVGDTTKSRIKSMFNLMYRYAMKHEIVDKDYASLCNTIKKTTPSKEKKPFTDNEINMLWDNLKHPNVDMLLIGIYSGWRPQELAILRKDNIDLENRTMTGGIKTDAGKNRCIPIHPRIFNLVKYRYDNCFNTLFEEEDGDLTYDKYRTRFKNVMKKLKIDHTPHETRHTFITLGKASGMDEYCLKLIVGHAIEDITEKIYTHRTLEQLRLELEKIK